jgi:hypothetical protein
LMVSPLKAKLGAAITNGKEGRKCSYQAETDSPSRSAQKECQ